MPGLSKRLKALDKKLDELGIMMLSELEGLLAGVIICPQLVPPGLWLPLVFTREEDEEPVVFDDKKQFDTLVGPIMDHYNSVIDDLNNGRYQPVYAVDPLNDEMVWEFWANGFLQAMSLAPESWEVYLASADEDVATAIGILVSLIGISQDESDFSEEEIEEFVKEAPGLIPFCVSKLHIARLENYKPNPGAKSASTHSGPKPGRNDPCPCGSGKKYKQCCGLN